MGKRAVGDDDRCRLALGRVLSRRFDEGLARGSKAELGEALGAPGKAGSSRVSKILGGELFPDRELGTIAEFVNLSLPTLLCEIALEIAVMDSSKIGE